MQGMRILLVEDDPAIIATLTELLLQEGYSVEARTMQNEAIALLECEHFGCHLAPRKWLCSL